MKLQAHRRDPNPPTSKPLALASGASLQPRGNQAAVADTQNGSSLAGLISHSSHSGWAENWKKDSQDPASDTTLGGTFDPHDWSTLDEALVRGVSEEDTVGGEAFLGASAGESDMLEAARREEGEPWGDADAWAGLGAEGWAVEQGYDGVGDWLSGDRATAGAKGAVRAGAGADARAETMASGGPSLAGRGILGAEAGAGASVEVGAEAEAGAEAYVQGMSAGAAARVGAEYGGEVDVDGRAKAGVDLLGLETGVGVQGSAGAEYRASTDASGSVETGLLSGLALEGQAAAGIQAMAEAAGSVDYSVLGVGTGLDAQGFAEVSAEASAQGSVGMGNPLTGRMGAMGAAEAFAGARAGGSIDQGLSVAGVDILKVSLSGEVSAGAGAGASGGLMIDEGVLTLDLSLMACAGVGAGLGATITIDLLAPLHIVLALLESNGILSSSDPDVVLSDILGFATGNKGIEWMNDQEASQGDLDPATADQGLPEVEDFDLFNSPVSGEIGALMDVFAKAGARIDEKTGAIDATGKGFDPLAVSGLPRSAQPGWDRALGQAEGLIGEAHEVSTEASATLEERFNEVIGTVTEEIRAVIDGFTSLLTGGWDVISGLFEGGLGEALSRGAELVTSAVDAVKAAANMLSSFFGWLMRSVSGLFSGYQDDKSAAEAGFFSQLGSMVSGIGAVMSGDFSEAGGLVSMLSDLAMSLAGDAQGAAEESADEADRAAELVSQAHGITVDLGHTQGALTVSREGQQAFDEVGGVMRDQGGPMADQAREQLSEVGDVMAATHQGAVQGASQEQATLESEGTSAFEGRSQEADEIVAEAS